MPTLGAPDVVPALVVAAAAPETSVLFVELGAVLLALALFARLATAIGMSPIPAYLAVGLAVGEGGLGILKASEAFVGSGAEIGVLLLLFMLGLEYTGAELRDNLRAGLPAGLLDLGLNLTPGVVAGLLLGWGPVAALVLGGVTYISSSGVISKLFADLGRLGNRETPAILTLLVIEDLVMAAYLPLLAILLIGTGLLVGVASLAIALGAAAMALVIAVRFGEAVSRPLHERSDEVVLLSVLGGILVVGGLAEQVQVSAAVGAFLVGIAVSGPVAEHARTLISPLRDVFAAIFFIFFGLQIEVRALPAVLPAALALAVVTAGTKIGTGWWAARRLGVGPRGRVRAGAALVARGEFSIVIAGLGVSAGVEGSVGPLAAAYVLLTVVAGPLLARFAEPLQLAVRRVGRA